MSENKFETFTYTPIELAATMTGTVNDTLYYLVRNGYIKDKDYEYLNKTLAVFPIPNRKGFGEKLLARFFGKDQNENAYVFRIIEVDPERPASTNKTKGNTPTLNVVPGDFGKDKK